VISKMAVALSAASLSFAPALAPVRAPTVARTAAPVMETVEDLEELSVALNPNIGFWDPLGMVDLNLWDKGEEGTIGWLRHAEIKHGRVAMAAFVGYCVQANGIFFPWAITGGPLGDGPTTMFADIAAAGSPSEQWDAVPTAGKLQILGTILMLEWVGETAKPHYTAGGKPGFYPSLKESDLVPHPIPFDLYDPFGLFGKMSDEQKERRLLMEINNGRAAMLGIFGFLSAAKGLDVPALNGIIPPYSGETMAYFSATDANLPFVQDMLDGWAKINIGA